MVKNSKRGVLLNFFQAILLSLLLAAPSTLLSQTLDSTIHYEYCDCPKRSNLLRDYSRFLPDKNTPEIRLRANFIFMQNDSGTGGFSENDALHQKYLDEITGTGSSEWSSLNFRYANMEDVNHGNTCYDGFVKDSRIRFLVNRIYIADTYGWNNDNDKCPDGCPDSYSCNWYLDYLHDKLIADSTIPPGINVFFTERASAYYAIADTNQYLELFGGRSCSMLPDCNPAENLKCHMRNVFLSFYSKSLIPVSKETYSGWDSLLHWDPYYTISDKDFNKNTYTWALGAGSIVAHELGHSLGLGHGYNHCPNNIMNNEGGSRNYLELEQLGNIHKNLCTTVLRNYVEGCPYSPDNIFEITGEELIDFDFTWYGDIVVRPGAVLTITCTVRMPDNARIIVERGAKLIVNGGKITSACEGKWLGIIVWGNSDRSKGKKLLKEHPADITEIYDFNTNTNKKGAYPADVNEHGVVILKNAIIENAACAVLTGRDSPLSAKFSGGIVLAENSIFRNNLLAVRILKFNYKAGDQPAAYYFKRCAFEADDSETKEGSCLFFEMCGVQGGTFLENSYSVQSQTIPVHK